MKGITIMVVPFSYKDLLAPFTRGVKYALWPYLSGLARDTFSIFVYEIPLTDRQLS